MTREEAIAYGKRVVSLGLNDETQAFCETAIKALEQQSCEDAISRQAAIDALKRLQKDISRDYTELDPMVMAGCGYIGDCIGEIKDLSSAQPEWNNHTVACMLAELFDDTCACNYNGIDEWLPGKCELLDSCPNPVGVACWEQYLKHRAERRTDD